MEHWALPGRLFCLLVQVFDFVLEDEKIRSGSASDADESIVVVLDRAPHFLVIAQFDAYRSLLFDELLQILHLLEVWSGGLWDLLPPWGGRFNRGLNGPFKVCS